MTSTSRILDLRRSGRITPEQGAMLLELRRLITRRRRPWWDRALTVMVHALLGWP